MRTVTFFGLLAIADAINSEWHKDDQTTINTAAIVLIIAVLMDISDFIKARTAK